MTIFFASGNNHKKQEMASLFAPHEVLIPRDVGLDFNPVENGTTFAQNSLIKAQTLWQAVQKCVIADDSGICVDLLGGRPGIFSARYQGMHKTISDDLVELPSDKRNALLLEEVSCALKKFREENPLSTKTDEELLTCRFVCALTLYLGKERFYCVQETIEGRLVKSIDEASGGGGFGYDPIFFLPEYGKTVADLSSKEKNDISHRARAAKTLYKLLN